MLANPSYGEFKGLSVGECLVVTVLKGDGTMDNPYSMYFRFYTTSGVFIGELDVNTAHGHEMIDDASCAIRR